jgi:hypothetical protein
MPNQEPESKLENAEQPSGEVFHPDDSDRGFLMWIHERLEHVHGESRLMDCMHKLRAIIADMPADRKTVSVGQGKNSLEALQQSILENDRTLATQPAKTDSDSK